MLKSIFVFILSLLLLNYDVTLLTICCKFRYVCCIDNSNKQLLLHLFYWEGRLIIMFAISPNFPYPYLIWVHVYSSNISVLSMLKWRTSSDLWFGYFDHLALEKAVLSIKIRHKLAESNNISHILRYHEFSWQRNIPVPLTDITKKFIKMHNTTWYRGFKMFFGKRRIVWRFVIQTFWQYTPAKKSNPNDRTFCSNLVQLIFVNILPTPK